MKKIYFILFLWAVLFNACNDNDDEQGGNNLPATGDVSFRDSVINVLETEGILQLPIRLSFAAPADYTLYVMPGIEYQTKEGTDYILGNPRVQVKKGDTEANVTLEIIDDKQVNPDRFVELRIMDAGGGKILTPDRCRVNIIDDESKAAVVFSEKEYNCDENQTTPLNIPIRLEGTPSGNTVKFKVKVNGGTAVEGRDYKIVSPMEFTLHASDEVCNLQLSLTDNDQSNDNRTIILEIIEVQGAMTTTSRGNCLVIIRDDDTGLSFSKPNLSIAETDNLLQIPVKLTRPCEEATSFTVEVHNGSATENTDFTIIKTVTIPAGQDSAYIEIKPIHVAGAGADKTFSLTLASCSDENIALNPAPCTVTIWDCDTQLEIAESSYDVLSSNSKIDVNISLAQPLSHDVTFTLESSNTKVFRPNETPVTIPAGETTVKIPVQISAPVIQKRVQETLHLQYVYGATAPETGTPVSLFYQLDRSSWSVPYFSSEEPTGEGEGNGTAVCMLDGKDNTFWHSEWNAATAQLPHTLIFDMGNEHVLTELEVLRRTDGQVATKTIQVFYTTATEDMNSEQLQQLNWQSLGTLNFSQTGNLEVMSIEQLSMRYFKFILPDSYRDGPFVSIAEVNAQGWLK